MTISFDEVRFIKLGNKTDKWAKDCIDNGWVPLGYPALDIMETQWQEDKEEELKKQAGKPFSMIKNFYTLGRENKTVLWITKHDSCLYWGITEGVSITRETIETKTVY